jgi:catechol 2,3-dioxygenase-like lactoylglutathione lyase family enzyme
MAEAVESTAVDPVPPAPTYLRINHAAFLCRDPEETRAFYEEVMGFRMVAAMVMPSGVGLAAAYGTELGSGGDEDGTKKMLTMFFEIAPDNYITFFDVPQTVSEEKFRVRDGVEEYHLAVEVAGPAELAQITRRLREHGVAVSDSVDLQAFHSVYFYDPNGIHLEVTTRDPKHDELLAWSASTALDSLEQWVKESRDERERRLSESDELRAVREDLKRRVVDFITRNVSEGATGATGQDG